MYELKHTFDYQENKGVRAAFRRRTHFLRHAQRALRSARRLQKCSAFRSLEAPLIVSERDNDCVGLYVILNYITRVSSRITSGAVQLLYS